MKKNSFACSFAEKKNLWLHEAHRLLSNCCKLCSDMLSIGRFVLSYCKSQDTYSCTNTKHEESKKNECHFNM